MLVSIAIAIASMGIICSSLGILIRYLPEKSSIRSIVRAVWSSAAIKTPLKLAFGSLWLSVTALHVLAWHLYLFDNYVRGAQISYFSSLMAIVLAWQLWNKASGRQMSLARVMGMQVLQVVGLLCCANFHSSDHANFGLAALAGPPGKLVAVQALATDSGTCILAYDRQVSSRELEVFYRQTEGRLAAAARFAMFKSEAQSHMNCHGWVFTGEHIIKGEDVPKILEGNSYQVVATPALNDLIIYKDALGAIVHTGVVCGFLGDDQPLVESKWGVAGTYVHLAKEQPYSPTYSFYRSPRVGHRLGSA